MSPSTESDRRRALDQERESLRAQPSERQRGVGYRFRAG